MKLIFCSKCQDIVRLQVAEERSCKCGACSGQYLEDGLYAWYKGESCIPLGFSNHSLGRALHAQPDSGMGRDFIAFVIPKHCDTFENRTNT